jgi:hypothetical protein
LSLQELAEFPLVLLALGRSLLEERRQLDYSLLAALLLALLGLGLYQMEERRQLG